MGVNFGLLLLVVILPAWVQAAVPASSLVSDKKTLCTITINSSQEKEIFRKKLPSSQFNVVELVPETAPGMAWIEGWSGANWFKKACERRIQCDILLISGHFAGTFFGRSGQSLSLNEMEKASCQSACDGIFKRPKEVYLFGCNTLADKSLDHRRPEDYVEVLRADGFSAEDAQAVALQRYTPWGASNLDRMRSLFPNAVGLYGFSSTSPLGKYVEEPLSKYLEGRAKTYASELTRMKKGDVNKALARAMSGFSFRQAETLSSAHQPLVCRMSQPKAASLNADKDLELIRGQLTSNEPLQDLPQILERLRIYSEVDSEKLKIWRQSLDGNAGVLRSRFSQMFAAKELQSHFVVRLGILELLQFLGQDSSQTQDQYQDFMVKEAFRRLSPHRAQEICAQRSSSLLRYLKLPSRMAEDTAVTANTKEKRNFVFGALSCLNFETDLRWLQKSYPENFLYSQDWLARQGQLLEMIRRSPEKSQDLRLLIPLLAANPLTNEVRALLQKALSTPQRSLLLLKALQGAQRLSEDALVSLMTYSDLGQDEELKELWIELWRTLKPRSEKVQMALFAHARRESDPSSWLAIFSGVDLHPQVKSRLMDLVRDQKTEGRSFVLNLLSRLSVDGEGLYHLALAATQDPEMDVRVEAADVLTRYFWEAIDIRLQTRMYVLLQTESSSEVLDETFRFWAKRGTRSTAVLQAMDKIWAQNDEFSDLRMTATDVMTHLSVSAHVVIDLWWSRLMKAAPNSESEAQLLQMLANANWKTHAKKTLLLERFRRDLTSEDPRQKQFATKVWLRHGTPDTKFLEATAQDLEIMVSEQNWMSARELAFELENFRHIPRVGKSLNRFREASENSLDGEI